jgi:hypothetical protein
MNSQGEFQVLTPEHITDKDLKLSPASPKAFSASPADLFELVKAGANADAIEKLWQVQKEWEANEGRKRFENAFATFKAAAPTIIKTKQVEFANKGGDVTRYSHAELHKITEIIGDSLRAVGIIHQWKTSDANGRTTVTCVLKGFGHTEEAATLSGPSDTSGGKNNIQAIGSTVTYLQRYTLLSACGLAAQGTDNDGKSEGMSEDAITDYCIQMQDCRTWADDGKQKGLKSIFAECWEKAKKAEDPEAKKRFEKVYNECKKNIAGGAR